MGKKITARINQKRQKFAVMVAVSFLFSVMIGAVVANCVQAEQTAEIGAGLQNFFGSIRESGLLREQSFWQVFIKYVKYDILIWLGGWIAYGIVLSGTALCFRGISIGFTTAMFVAEYGMKGFVAVFLSILPQNLILVPAYLFMAWVALCFLYDRNDGGYKKAGLRREKQKQAMEYNILFAGSMVLVAVGTAVEIGVIPILMESTSLFLGAVSWI